MLRQYEIINKIRHYVGFSCPNGHYPSFAIHIGCSPFGKFFKAARAEKNILMECMLEPNNVLTDTSLSSIYGKYWYIRGTYCCNSQTKLAILKTCRCWKRYPISIQLGFSDAKARTCTSLLCLPCSWPSRRFFFFTCCQCRLFRSV